MPLPVRLPSCVMPRKSVAMNEKNVAAVVMAAMKTPGMVARMMVRMASCIDVPRFRSST